MNKKELKQWLERRIEYIEKYDMPEITRLVVRCEKIGMCKAYQKVIDRLESGK